jgi:hypothetical protein
MFFSLANGLPTPWGFDNFIFLLTIAEIAAIGAL